MPPESFTSSIRGCARCNGDGHADVVWQPLTHPIEDTDGTVWTHWAPCPTNGEPILMRTTPCPHREQRREKDGSWVCLNCGATSPGPESLEGVLDGSDDG